MKYLNAAKKFGPRLAVVGGSMAAAGSALAQTTSTGAAAVADAVDWTTVIAGISSVGIATIAVILVVKGIAWIYGMTKRG